MQQENSQNVQRVEREDNVYMAKKCVKKKMPNSTSSEENENENIRSFHPLDWKKFERAIIRAQVRMQGNGSSHYAVDSSVNP